MIQNDTIQQETAETDTLQYKTSSLCSTGACVEVAIQDDGRVNIRDNKDLSKTPLSFTAEEWKAFVGGVKNGEFDLK